MKLLKAEAGVNDGKAGLLSAAGLFAKGGIFDKKSESFNIQELDPYLLFDARSSMLGTLENPTLDLDPATPSTLDVITATRAGTATFTDPDGLIATASPDTVRVDYTQGAELTPTVFQHVVQTDYSASPNVIGTKVTLSDISGPDGESGGVRVTETANNTQHYLAVKNKEIASGTTYTVSFYVKEGAYPSVKFYTQSAKIYSDVTFNFSTGTATFGGPDLIANSGSVSNVGGGWYRVVYSATANGSGEMDLYVCSKDLSSYAGDVNNFTDYYGFQVEEGTTASSFVENTTGSPKFLSSAVYSDRFPMILVEPSATNLVDNSNSFSASGTAVKTTGFEAPDGTNNSTKISNIQDGDGEKAHCPLTSVSGSTQYSGSIYIKGTGGQTIRVQAKRATTGSFSGSGTQTITFDGTWQRVTNLTWTTASNNNDAFIVIKNEFGTTADEVYLWGSQLEQGSVSTSVIPTSGSTVTRVADDLVISGSDFDFYNASEGTFYVESELQRETEVGFQPFLFDADNGDADRVLLYNETAGDVLGLVRASGAGYQINLGTHPSVNTFSRTAFSYKANNLDGSKDGNSVTPVTTAVIPTTISRLNVGSHYTKAENLYLNGHIKRLIYWPYSSDRL